MRYINRLVYLLTLFACAFVHAETVLDTPLLVRIIACGVEKADATDSHGRATVL